MVARLVPGISVDAYYFGSAPPIRHIVNYIVCYLRDSFPSCLVLKHLGNHFIQTVWVICHVRLQFVSCGPDNCVLDLLLRTWGSRSSSDSRSSSSSSTYKAYKTGTSTSTAASSMTNPPVTSPQFRLTCTTWSMFCTVRVQRAATARVRSTYCRLSRRAVALARAVPLG